MNISYLVLATSTGSSLVALVVLLVIAVALFALITYRAYYLDDRFLPCRVTTHLEKDMTKEEQQRYYIKALGLRSYPDKLD